MSDNIEVQSEIWVESQPQEMHGYGWFCRMCDAGQHRMYSYDSVEQSSFQHLREEHQIREGDFEDAIWNS